MDAMKSNEDA